MAGVWRKMLRKSLFWGLTLVLVVALVNLIIRGRRLEKQRAQEMVEVVQESKPTPTRVFAPWDLQVIQSKMQLEKDPAGNRESQAARHEIEIRNSGSVPYLEIQLKFNYFNRAGKELVSRTQIIPQRILPGALLIVTGIVVREVPASATDSRVVIVSADIAK
jgi:hypothetical protein